MPVRLGLGRTSMSHVAVSLSKVSLTRGGETKKSENPIKDIIFQFTKLLNLRTNTPLTPLFSTSLVLGLISLTSDYTALFFCFFYDALSAAPIHVLFTSF